MTRAERIAQRCTLAQIGEMRRVARALGLRRCIALANAAFNARFSVVIERNHAERQAALFLGEGDGS